MQFTPLETWQPPPQPALFGEISADGTRIILIAQGDSFDMSVIGSRLSHITPLISKTGLGAAVTIPLTWAAVTQVAHSFNGGNGSARWVPLPRLTEWILAEFARRTAAPEPLKAEFPSGLSLRPYQEEGAARIAAARRFLLLDEPGVGKSCTTLAGLAEIQARGGEIFPMVIIVPSWGVARHWQQEIAAWAPSWRTVKWGGPGRDIGKALDRAGILISTYATARVDAADVNGPLAALRPVTVVGDEIHFCRGNSTKQSLAFRRIAAHADNVIGLSGTPITRDTGDIYPVLDAMDPLSWPSRERFVRRYCQVADTEYGQKIEGLNSLAEPEFRVVLTGSMRRVAKADVLKDLPPKIYSVRYVDIPAAWRKAYDGMEADMLAALPDNDDELPAFDSLTRFGRLSQLACSAADVEVTEEWDDLLQGVKKHYKVTLKAPSWKADELLEILAERRGHPVVSFTPSRQMAMIAGQAAEKAGYRVGYYTGLGNGITEKTRQADKDALQAGKLDLLSATTGAGGTGITLTAAGTAVFLQRPWFEESIQSEDRLHRIGSEIHEHGVEIIDIVSRDSIDSRRRELLKEHASQAAVFVQDMRLVRSMLGGLPA
jgi:SNF2 family DNA or RNA helicase